MEKEDEQARLEAFSEFIENGGDEAENSADSDNESSSDTEITDESDTSDVDQ